MKANGRSLNLANELTSDAIALEGQQQAFLEMTTVEQAYQESLALYVTAKHGQVESIEDRLEGLIDRQQARLQQMQSSSPGVFSRPGAKRAWQAQQAQQSARLQSLHNRLEIVREIKDGMGLHSPKLDELATRKLRIENPGLASDWDAMREAQRVRQELIRREREEEKRKQDEVRTRPVSMRQSLSPGK